MASSAVRRLALLVVVAALAAGSALALAGLSGVARASALRALTQGGVYVGLGDSYTSGPLILNQHGTPIGCARSDHNYPSLVAAAVAPSVFRDVSCASAVTDNMTQPQSVPLSGVNPPQFNALSSNATLVTVGIGGNDADLVGIAESCIRFDLLSPAGSPCKDHYTINGRDTTAASVDAIAPKIAAVLRGIHARSPLARTLLVGYPAVLPLSGPGCWPEVPLSSGDVPWFRSLLVRINGVLAAQAAANGAEYVDTYTGSEGHDVCQLPTNRWFEGVVPTSPAFPLHPNGYGEASMARSVLAVLSHAAPPSPVAPPAARPGCPLATGRLQGTRLGLVKLGMTRLQARRAYTHSANRGQRFMDFFCLTPNGVRVGYAAPKLLRTISRRQRIRVHGRVVWASTSDRLYSLRGVRPGAALRVAAKRLHTARGFRVGRNYWYFAPNGSSSALLKVRHGVVEEIGIADKALTQQRRARLAFAQSFS